MTSKVVDIERVWVDRLAADLLLAIRDGFAGPGMYNLAIGGIGDAGRWRRAARACARKLGVCCSTSVSADGAVVWVVDTSLVMLPDHVRARRSIDNLLREPTQPDRTLRLACHTGRHGQRHIRTSCYCDRGYRRRARPHGHGHVRRHCD